MSTPDTATEHVIDSTAIILPATNDETPRTAGEASAPPITPDFIRYLYPEEPFTPWVFPQGECLPWAEAHGYLTLGDDGRYSPTPRYLALRHEERKRATA